MSSKLDGKHTIRKHWKPTAVFTGSMRPGHGQKVAESELLPGELSAELFQVGCYTVRSAQRVYKVCEPGYSPEQEVPANSEETELVRKDMLKTAAPILGLAMTCGVGFRSWQDRLRITHEISAQHCDSKSFTIICRAAQSRNYTWHEEIGPILAAKEHIAISSKRASLFVCNTYVGDSFSTETWYKLSAGGEVTTLSLHPYDSDADKASFS